MPFHYVEGRLDTLWAPILPGNELAVLDGGLLVIGEGNGSIFCSLSFASSGAWGHRIAVDEEVDGAHVPGGVIGVLVEPGQRVPG
jgi:hypothetical protein